MASNVAAGEEAPRSKQLPNRPETKLPPIPNGFRVQKRPLPSGPSPSSHRPSSHSDVEPAFDQDGYFFPARASHTTVVKVSSGASFMSLVRRVRKALERRTQAQARGQAARGMTLAARVAAMKGAASAAKVGGGGDGGNLQGGGVEDALDDVVLVATGRAIARAVEVGGFFTRERELVVLVRTRTLQAVDDVVAGDGDEVEEADVEDQVRVRNVSCVEVGIRWAS